MLTEQTMTQLYDMKLHGMAAAYEEQRRSPQIADMDFDERFGMLADRQWRWREERALATRLRTAKFKMSACMEDINYGARRGLKRATMDQLRSGEWISFHQNVILTGPTGTGKTYLACALGTNACRAGYRVRYFVTTKLFRMLRHAHADGSYMRLTKRLTNTELLIVDDWGMETLKPGEYRDFLEILDDRQGNGSMLMTSQFDVDLWHDTIGNPTVADAILDRLIHNAHHIELEGESMRKRANKQTG
jgi:DNA replication protein DnaC